MDVIILTDQYDASLLILKKRFHWNYLDIFYAKKVVFNSANRPISPEVVAKILSPKVNLGDQMFYRSLNKTWWQQEELKKSDFWDEVSLNINLYIRPTIKPLNCSTETCSTAQQIYDFTKIYFHVLVCNFLLNVRIATLPWLAFQKTSCRKHKIKSILWTLSAKKSELCSNQR